MIVTFDDLLSDWVVKVNIRSAKKNSQLLNLGSDDPLFYSLKKDSYQHTRLSGKDVGNAVILLAHGDEKSINELDANSFCNRYRLIPNIKNKPLILISCDSGKPRDNNISLAQEIANELRNDNVTVYAPNGPSIFCEYALAIVNSNKEESVLELQEFYVSYYDSQNLPVPECIADNCFKALITYILSNPLVGNVKMFDEIPEQITDYTILGLTKFTAQ